MKTIPEADKFIVAASADHYLGFCGVARSGARLVCAYLRTDRHLRTTTDVMTAVSDDGGRNWHGHRSLAHLDCRNDGAVWLSPEINALADGRLVLICDRAVRTADQEHVSLYRWQQADRGMNNCIFYSKDGGDSWTEARIIDAVGGEPERVHRLSDGTLIYSCTMSADRARPMYGDAVPATLEPQAYYRSILMASHDGGETFAPYAVLADDEFYSDCEVGLVEMAPGRLLAISRCGDAGGHLGQCSRIRRSDDFGRTWSAPALLPIYAQRPIPGMLQAGRVMLSWRNYSGTVCSCAAAFEPEDWPSYEPGCFLRDERCCRWENGVLVLDTGEGIAAAAAYGFYPAQDEQVAVTVEAELQVETADRFGCCIAAGVWVRFAPGRVELENGVGFAADTASFHRYRIEREEGRVRIWVDGCLELDCEAAGLAVRRVAVGNRPFSHAEYLRQEGADPTAEYASTYFLHNRALTRWRSLRVTVGNTSDHAIDWRWRGDGGYPDPFRRERTVLLDYNDSFSHADNGYSGWTQLPDGTIVVCDYTRGAPPQPQPFIRAYRFREEQLPGGAAAESPRRG